jgi:ribonuclease R
LIQFLKDLITGIKRVDVSEKYMPLIHKWVAKGYIKYKKDTYKLSKKLRIGKIDLSVSGQGYLETYDNRYSKDLLISKHDLMGAMQDDIVLAKRVFSHKRPAAKIIEIVERSKNEILVYTKNINNKIIGVAFGSALYIPISEKQKELKHLKDGTLLLLDVENKRVVKVLGHLEDERVDEIISLFKYNKKEEFSQEALLEAKAWGDEVDKTHYPNRVDLTHLPLCTIDPNDAKDFDDAIYFDKDNHTLYVSIADVSFYVQSMGNIDKEAIKRGFSIYFPHKSIPMLPRTLSENICSLKPDVDRLAYTFIIKLDKKSHEVVDSKLVESVINSKRRYTYDEIDGILTSNTPESGLEYIVDLNNLCKKIRKKRLKNACEFESDDIRMVVDEQQRLVATRFEKESDSHSLVEECMLLANKEAAKILGERGIFRVHEPPSYEKIENLIEELRDVGIVVEFSENLYQTFRVIQKQALELGIKKEVDRLIIRSQMQAKYDSVNIGHFGLGFDKYTHFTSPIRRYSDLILHRILKAKSQYDEKRVRFLLSDIDTICQKVSTLEREAEKVAWDYKDRKFARWARENLNSIVEAIVISNKSKIMVSTTKGIVGAKMNMVGIESISLFAKVRVEIIETDIANPQIICQFIEMADV